MCLFLLYTSLASFFLRGTLDLTFTEHAVVSPSGPTSSSRDIYSVFQRTLDHVLCLALRPEVFIQWSMVLNLWQINLPCLTNLTYPHAYIYTLEQYLYIIVISFNYLRANDYLYTSTYLPIRMTG